MTLTKQPPNMVYKLQKKLVAEKKKSVMQKDNSEDTQSQISSFCGGQEDVSSTQKIVRWKK